MKTTEHSVKFCPKCGSTEIFWASGLPQLWSIWECRKCGYRGALVVEDGKLAKKIRLNYLKKRSKVQTHSRRLRKLTHDSNTRT